MRTIKIIVDGEELVGVPVADFRRMTAASAGVVDAKTFFRDLLARNVKLARTTAGLTQRALAHRMAVSQRTISQAEKGKATVSSDYVVRVLVACDLPQDWVAPVDPESE